MTILTSARLIYEPFAAAHFPGLHAMNSDPDVMRYLLGRPETPDETRAMIARVQARWAEWGYSWWTLLDRASGEVVGAGGIQHLGRQLSGPHEIGWRLRRDAWGRGLASEAARTMAGYAFTVLDAPRLCAIRHPDNLASLRVMERLGMRYVGLDHCDGMDVALHNLSRADWRAQSTLHTSDPAQ
jgi:RimJ/RimL family protein N-acetyltransferase